MKMTSGIESNIRGILQQAEAVKPYLVGNWSQQLLKRSVDQMVAESVLQDLQQSRDYWVNHQYESGSSERIRHLNGKIAKYKQRVHKLKKKVRNAYNERTW